MQDRRSVRGALLCGTTIEIVGEDGFDRAIGARADLDGPLGGGFNALPAIGSGKPDEGLARIRSAASDGDETCEIPATGAPQAPRPKDRIAPNRTPPWKAPASCSGASSRRARSQPIDPIAQ